MEDLYVYAACRGEPIQNYFELYEEDKEVAAETDDLCFDCPVREQCLKKGVETSGTGVFGATYLVLGKYSKTRNSHKDPYISKKLQQEVEQLRSQK